MTTFHVNKYDDTTANDDVSHLDQLHGLSDEQHYYQRTYTSKFGYCLFSASKTNTKKWCS